MWYTVTAPLGAKHSGIQDPQFEWLDHVIVWECLFCAITECLRLAVMSGNHLVQTPCSYQGQLEQVIQGFKCQVSNISNDGDSTTTLGNLVMCLTTLTVKSSVTLKWNFLYFALCLMHLGLPLGASEEILHVSLHYSITCSFLTAWYAFFCSLGWQQTIQKEELQSFQCFCCRAIVQTLKTCCWLQLHMADLCPIFHPPVPPNPSL